MNIPRTVLTVVIMLISAACVPSAGAVVEVDGSILGDTTWTNADTIRAVGSITIAASGRLTVEPGTVVHFIPGVSLTVAGELQADAGTGDRITFSASADTSGGSPVAGGWTGIAFQALSTGTVRNCNIRYAISGISALQAVPVIDGCIIQDFQSVGISIDGALSNPPLPFLIDNCIIEQVSPDLRGTAKAVFTYRKAYLMISNSTLANCFYGIEFFGVSGSSPMFEIVDCDIRENELHGIYTHAG